MVKKYNNFLHVILFFVFLSFIPQKIYSQCAGSDANLTICDILNPANKSIDLFGLLGPAATNGGVWSDDDNTGGLSETTGILNVHLILQSGIYKYTYTVSGINGCSDNSATVIVTIGSYAGKPSPTATVCSDDVTFNLFQAFDSAYLGPHSNGQWHDDNTNQNIRGSFIDVKTLEGTYQYTYTMPAVGTCPAPPPSTIFVTVKRAPESGSASRLLLCANNGLSAYTNYDLFNSISGQDPGGTWVDNSNTGELNFKGDHTINIEKIYNNFGAKDYSFSYVVKSPNPICPEKQTVFAIKLEEKLDFTGAILKVNSDICESEIPTAAYSATITRGPANIPDGQYFVTFNVTGAQLPEIVSVNFINGVARFPVKSAYFQRVGAFTVNISNIFFSTSLRLCQNIIDNLSDDLIVYPDPDLTDAIITPITTCQNKEVLVQISNAVKLADGDYNIIYNLAGANNVPSQVVQITMSGGNASFTIPEIFNSRSGNSIITITAITNLTSQCVKGANLKGDILTNPLPNGAALRLQIPDACFGKEVSVTISGLQTLTDVTVSYILSGSNISAPQTVVLAAADGKSSFILPSNLLTSSGSTIFSVTNLKNNITTCDIDVTGVAASFLLNPIPGAPLAVDQSFCKVDDATIANLEPKGTQYKWYISATASTPLAATYILKSEDYFVKETSTAGCVSEPSKITVTIKDTPAPILNPDGQNFCGLDNPTILNLSNNTSSPSTVVWYDAAVNGNLLPSSTPLTDRTTYYGFDFSTGLDCFSEDYLGVTVSLIECDSPEYSLFIPDGFSPNGDGINDSFIIPDIDFLYPNYTLDIYNRYGNGMYKGFKNKPGWDGKNYENSGISGGIAPNGVYFYILNFNKDNKPPKQGRLYLNR